MRDRKVLFLGALAFLVFANPAAARELHFQVAKTQSCGCCVAWIEKLKARGHTVSSTNLTLGFVMQHKKEAGVPLAMASCHTAKVENYTVEGHVPPEDVESFLDNPSKDAIGLAVPGMPMGSPGMDFGDGREAYNVYVIMKDGSSQIYRSYEAIE